MNLVGRRSSGVGGPALLQRLQLLAGSQHTPDDNAAPIRPRLGRRWLPRFSAGNSRREIARDIREVDELGGEVGEAVRGRRSSRRARARPGSRRRTAGRSLDVVVERHAVAELAADERLARDRERDLARAGVAEAARAQRDVVPRGDAVDVALVDDAPVRVQEVERDRRAAPLPATAVRRRSPPGEPSPWRSEPSASSSQPPSAATRSWIVVDADAGRGGAGRSRPRAGSGS